MTEQEQKAFDQMRDALEQSKRWHQGDRWRFSDRHNQWEAHRDVIDAALTAANAVPQSQIPTIECSYLDSKDDVLINATLVIGEKTHRMVGEAMYFEVKHKLESLARTVMADQTVIDLPRIQSGKPLYQLIMEENERWLKEDDV